MHAVIDTSNSAFPQYWNQLLANDPLQNPLYAPPRQDATWETSEFKDRSFVIVAEDEPVFGCSMTLHTDASGRRCLGYFGVEASTLVNRQSLRTPSNSFNPEAIRLLQDYFRQLMEELKPDALDYLDPVTCGLMSPITQVLLERGAVPRVLQARRINLMPSRQAIWNLISEPYQELINWGREHLHLSLVSGIDIDPLQTRIPELIAQGPRGSQAHWRACRELVRQGNGFIVQARQTGEETRSALFVHNDTTCHYVIDDSLLDSPRRPVLHSMIWYAMVRSKQFGCSQFDVGRSAGVSASDSPDQAATAELEPAQFGGTPQTRLKVSLIQ